MKRNVAIFLLAVLALAGAALAGIKPSQSGRVQTVEAGTTLSVAGTLDIPSGGVFKVGGTTVTSSAAELNGVDGVTASAAELNLLDGVTSSTAELNIVDGVTSTAAEITANSDGVASTITFAAAAGAANVAEVTVTMKDGAGGTVAAVQNLDLWLSDAATCEGLTGVTTSGAVAAKGASGTDLATYTAKKALRVQTLATGVYILSITDTAKTGFYVCGQAPATGKSVASAQLITGNYG